MDNEDREATPAEPSSSQLCETIDGIDGYLSGEAPSSDVIDSSHLFSGAFDEDEHLEESHSKSPTSSPCLIPFGKTYNYNEAAIACQVDQSHFCERPDVYSSESSSKQGTSNFNPIELDDSEPGPSSSGNLSTPICERPDFHSDSSNSSFEPTSNENREDTNQKLTYPIINFGEVPEASSGSYNPSSSKQADSSNFTGNKGPGKLKNSKGKGKGKSMKSSLHPKFNIVKNFRSRENAVESTNKHSLFSVHSSRLNNPLLEIENRVNQSGLGNEAIETEEEPVNTSSSSSSSSSSPQCEFPSQRNMQSLNEDETYMVASSSGGINCMDHMIDLKSPTTPGDSCLVSSSTGQLDSLPPTPVNFQGNDASHSSPASSPLNPPVLDSTVDSTSGQNLLSSPYSDVNEIARSNDEIEFGCSLDEERNEISTSVSHLHHGVDSQDLNLLVGPQSVFVEQQPNGSAHFVGPFISLDTLNSHSLHSTLTDEKNGAEAVSALIPTTSSAYLPDCLEMPGSSHMSDASKRLVYERRKEAAYRSSLSASNSSLGQSSSVPLNNMGNLSFGDETNLNSCNPDGDLSHVGLMELRISEMEPESSNLVASSANLDNEEFPSASSGNALSPSGNNFESGSTLAQLNQHYLLGIGENSLGSEDGLSPQSVSQAAPGLSEGSLGLSQQLRETEESLESTSNFPESLELGLGPQQLRRIMESRQEPQSLIPPPHLLEEAHNTDASANIGQMDSSISSIDGVKNSESMPVPVGTDFPTASQSETAVDSENSFVIMVSETDAPQTSHFNSIVSQFGKIKPSREKDSKQEVASNIELHLKSRNHFLKETKSCTGLNSSLPGEPKSDEKHNSYRIPNGFIKTGGDSEVVNGVGLPDSNEDQPGLFPERYENRSTVGAISRSSVPVNIHSLFTRRPTVRKAPTTTGQVASFSYFTASKSSEVSQGAPSDETIEKEHGLTEEGCVSGSSSSTTPTTISSRVDLCSPSGSTIENKNSPISEFDKEQFVQSEELSESTHNRNARPDAADEEEELMSSVTTDADAHLPEDTASTSTEMLLEVRQMPQDSDTNLHPNEDSGHPNENTYWCGDCEMFLRTKCRMHRIQTIMDKPVLTRAWASLPAQHLSIKIVPTDKDSQEKRNGVFARKSIPKRTQFGPLEGRYVTEVPPNLGIDFKTTVGGYEGYLDVSEEGFSNWMRFVRPADTFSQMNCAVIEEENFIYFLTTASIPPKTELRVGYSKQYAVKYNLPLLVPTEEEEKELQKSLSCNECNSTFASQAELDDHTATHSHGEYSEGRPRRKARPKGFGNKQSSPPLVHSPRLVKRVKMNKRSDGGDDNSESSSQPNKKGRDTLECSYCDLCFHESQLLQIHILGHNATDASGSNEDVPQFAGADSSELSSFSKNFQNCAKTCPSCRKSFETIEELIEHTKEHSFVRQKDDDGPQAFKCKLCYKSFCTRERLMGHAESHKCDTEKPFSCFHCFRRFCNKSALGSHLNLHSEGEGIKVYDCPICQEKFYTISFLKTHLPSHCFNGEYTCPTCKKKFPSYHKIRRHIRSYHSAVHPCQECGKHLPSLEKLKVHLVSHSDRRDFACPMCQKCFKRKDKMKEHLKRIHTIKREPNNNTFSKKRTNPKFVPKVDPSDYKQFIYKCDLCLVGFKRRGMLVNHLSKRHPNIPLSSIPELNQPILRTSHSYFCQYCEKAYVSTTKRKLHILKNHPGAELPPPHAPMGGGGEGGSKTTRTYAASCPWCPRQYATKAKLMQHQRHHHNRGAKSDNQQQEQSQLPPPPPSPVSTSNSTKEHPQQQQQKEDAEENDAPKEDILSQAFGRVSGKAHLVRVEPQGSQTVVELRMQPEGSRERPSAKGEPSTASLGDQVLMSPSLILPHDGAAYALLTPDGGDAFTFSLRSGQILPSVGGFSVLSTTSEASVGAPDDGTEPGPSSRLLPIDDATVPHSHFTLDLNGAKGESCVVAQVGADNPSPVLVWQPSISFAPSS